MQKYCQSSSFHEIEKVEKIEKIEKIEKHLFREENFFFRDANLINKIACSNRNKWRNKRNVLFDLINECQCIRKWCQRIRKMMSMYFEMISMYNYCFFYCDF
jgi:hypothetical protein